MRRAGRPVRGAEHTRAPKRGTTAMPALIGTRNIISCLFYRDEIARKGVRIGKS
jgi:hypothetical protein